MSIQRSIDDALNLVVAESPATVSTSFLGVLGIICTRKAGSSVEEDEIVTSSNYTNFTDDIAINQYFVWGGVNALLIFEDTVTTDLSKYNSTIGAVVATTESGFDVKTIINFKRNVGLQTILSDDLSEESFAVTDGKTVLKNKDLSLGWQFGFYGAFFSNNFIVPIYKNFGTVFGIPETLEESQILKPKRYTYLVNDLLNGELAFASAGNIAISDFFYLQQLEIELQNTFKTVLVANNNTQQGYTDSFISTIETALSSTARSFTAQTKFNTLSVNIARRANQAQEDIIAHVLNQIRVNGERAGAIYNGKGTVNLTN